MGQRNRSSRQPLFFTLVGAAFLLGQGCSACTSPVEGEGSTVPGSCESSGPLIAPQKTDILFVVDNSGSMTEEQEGVAKETTAFVEELKRGGGVAQDFHLGVISTTVYRNAAELPDGGALLLKFPGQAGRLFAVPNTLPDGGREITAERVLLGDDPDLVDKFGRLIRIGTGGSGQETPFEAARLALSEPILSKPLAEGGNAGFLRDGARLLIVVLTDEDDCSEQGRDPLVVIGRTAGPDYCGDQSDKLTAVETYHSFFNGLRDSTGARKEVLWAAIAPVARSNKAAGPQLDGDLVRNVDCPTSFQPGPRHRRMAELFDITLENLASICRTRTEGIVEVPDYRETLADIAAIANSGQSLEVRGIPAPGLMQVEITRKSGELTRCTLNNGLSYEPAAENRGARIFFEGSCRRRGDDQGLALKLLCAG